MLPLEKRQEESQRIRKRYPDRVPVLTKEIKSRFHFTWKKEEASNDLAQPQKEHRKFLVPNDFTLGQFMFTFRKKTKLQPEEAIVFSVRSNLLNPSMLMSQIYKEYRDQDGFLYMTWQRESVFG